MENLKMGEKGEQAAEKLCLSMHKHGVAEQHHLKIMIDHFVNQDEQWKVDANSGALMWYNKGKGNNSTIIPQQDGMHKIDLHNCSRGLAAVKLVDHLLHLRSEWLSSDCDDSLVLGVGVIVGRGIGSGKHSETPGTQTKFKSTVPVLKGAATRLLTRINIEATVDASNSGRLIIDNQELLTWFQSEEAKEWSNNNAPVWLTEFVKLRRTAKCIDNIIGHSDKGHARGR
jgi:hypothetical protein